MTWLLTLIPAPYRMLAALAVVAALLGAVGVQTVRLALEQASHAKDVAAFSVERAAAARATAREEANQRSEEARRQQEKTNVQEISRMEDKRITSAAMAAGLAADGLRNAAQLAARPSQTSSDTHTCPGSPPTSTGPGVLADVLVELDQLAGELAEAVERSRGAGEACVRSYDSLTAPP